EIHGMPEGALPELDKPTILFCDDLAPADAGALDPKYVKALVCRGGGPTSHFVIVSRQLGIPCIISAKGIDNVEDGELALVDG
ncbi:PEP-utilizing enzyme, partial [Aerococcus urinae]